MADEGFECGMKRVDWLVQEVRICVRRGLHDGPLSREMCKTIADHGRLAQRRATLSAISLVAGFERGGGAGEAAA